MSAPFAPDIPPYARALGMVIDHVEPEGPVLAMDFAERIVGRPGFVHGGALGGLLEMAGYAALLMALGERSAQVRLKPVNISIEFLRGAVPARTFARGTVLRAGRRIANVRVEAWQSDRARPVASGWTNYLLSPKIARQPG